MGLGVKHFRLYGTREQLQEVLKLLPTYSTDVVLQPIRPIYQAMNDALGVEVCEYCVSRRQLHGKTVGPIVEYARTHPTFLYSITWKDGRVIDNGIERFSNIPEVDYDYPGPFGALCKAYGKSYWNETEEQKIARKRALGMEGVGANG